MPPATPPAGARARRPDRLPRRSTNGRPDGPPMMTCALLLTSRAACLASPATAPNTPRADKDRHRRNHVATAQAAVAAVPPSPAPQMMLISPHAMDLVG